MEAAEQKGVLTAEQFIAVYESELGEGKYWGVEHDLNAINGAGMVEVGEPPYGLWLDYVFYSSSTLGLVGVGQMIDNAGLEKVNQGDFLPNCWHPSDHLPVSAVLRFN